MDPYHVYVSPVRLNGVRIGEGAPCFIIAEAGANHNRDLDMAKELIDVAAEAGCDAVKFQTYSAETLYAKGTPRFSYLGDRDVFDLIKQCELPREWQQALSDYAKSRSILFFSTPFDTRAVDELDEIGVPAFKIASFELVDLPFIRYIAAKGRPIILSTGMANLGEIEEAIQAAAAAGNRQMVLLHCNSLYPTPIDAVNLRAMVTMKHAFHLPVGFSDHTVGITAALAAAALGASVIEKHFTLSRELPGPDHGPFALEPGELKEMVDKIREIEKALGNGLKRRLPEEEEMAEKGRRSVIAAVKIPAGTRITRDMLVIKRPGYGIAPKHLDLIIGKEAKTEIQADEPVTWQMI